MEPGLWLTTSLQYGLDAKGNLVPGGAGPETTQAMTNIERIYGAAGLRLNSHAFDCWLYLEDQADFDVASAAYKAFFPSKPTPTRTPPGVRLAGPAGAGVGVKCTGGGEAFRAISPPDFFADDFNSQGILAGNLFLYTAGQVGADPKTGDLVPGGLKAEAVQIVDNLAVVFAFAFQTGREALARAVHCLVGVAGEPDWAEVSALVRDLLGPRLPALSIVGYDPGDGASMEMTCVGADPSRVMAVLDITLPWDGPHGVTVLQARGQEVVIFAQSSLQLGRNTSTGGLVEGGARAQTTQALFNVDRIFRVAYPDLARAPGHVLGQVATQCELFVASAEDVAAALEAYNSFFASHTFLYPTRVVTVAGLPDGGLAGVRCDGAYAKDA